VTERITSWLVIAVFVSGALTGCVSVPAGTSLATPTPSSVSLDRGAWLAPVEISDPQTKQIDEIRHSLTLSIAGYTDRARFFRRVNLLPGQPSPDELVLHFRFDHYQLERTPHPAYFPGALLTLTLYIWLGGPIYVDQAHLSGSLALEDPSGKELVRVANQYDDRHSVNLWSQDYMLPSAIEARTTLVRFLLDQAVFTL
jgi:hypothetical protein